MDQGNALDRLDWLEPIVWHHRLMQDSQYRDGLPVEIIEQVMTPHAQVTHRRANAGIEGTGLRTVEQPVERALDAIHIVIGNRWTELLNAVMVDRAEILSRVW